MRTLLLFPAIIFFLASCGDTQQERDAVDALAGNWDEATAEVTKSVNQIAEVQEKANALLAKTNNSEIKGSTSEQQTGLEALQKKLQQSVSRLSGLSQQAFEFVNRWQEGADQLNALKEASQNGNLPGDVERQINELQSLMQAGREKTAEWKAQTNKAKATVQQAKLMLQEQASLEKE